MSPTLSACNKTTLAPGRTLRLSADYFGYAKDLRQDYLIRPYGAAASQLRRDSPACNRVCTLAAVSYGYHTDVLVDSYSRDAATQVVISSYQNFPSAHELNAILTLMKPLLAGKWQTVTTLGATLARVNGRPDLSTARPGAFLLSNRTLSLGHGVKAEASVMYMSPLTYGGVATAAVVYSSLGASKTVLKGAGTLTLSFTGPFNVQQRRYEVLAAGLHSLNVDKAESRFVKLSSSYKFGNQKVKARQRRSLGTEAERARLNY